MNAARGVAVAAAVCAGMGAVAKPAQACGCTSPPVPTVNESGYAVNQQSEQIIFEVEPGFVTAHVLIRYVGDPSQFAWLVPVPAVPELDLSESALFGLLDNASAPLVRPYSTPICPAPAYRCEYHSFPNCDDGGNSSSYSSSGVGPSTGSGMGTGGGGAGSPEPPGVEVKKKEQIGSYETVVFAAGDAQAAVDWLQNNGFIVNSTMTPYMQPYLDANMLFVAARLIPGAGAEEIKPLQMRYAAAAPMIPLQLTAVAAEPHLTVTSYIFGDSEFVPDDHPLVTIDSDDIAEDRNGRVNYPMVLARAIDDAGRDGFVAEYAGTVPLMSFQQEQCCSDENDFCALGNDGQCQCPNQDFDAADCDDPELLAAVDQLEELQAAHMNMTRLTTRLSPEEMTFDPGFVPGDPGLDGKLVIQAEQLSLQGCEDDIIDQQAYAELSARQDCSALYCGAGDCVITAQGAGCSCYGGFVARQFFDLDGSPSVTCVPDEGTVDFSAGGLMLPDACQGVVCGEGSCMDVGGFPSCTCGPGAAAVAVAEGVVPSCSVIEDNTLTPGARDYSAALAALSVCAPEPPDCGQWGWLVPNENITVEGVMCASSFPAPGATEPGPEPSCEDLGFGPADNITPGGSGCSGGCRAAPSQDDDAPLALMLMGLLGWTITRRRRR